MSKSYCSLGLMSGTSADGVDASIIQSNGDNEYKVILDKYFVYSQDIYDSIHSLKDKISNSKDLINFSKKIQLIEKEITLFHAKVVNEIIKDIISEKDMKIKLIEKKMNDYGFSDKIDEFKTRFNDYKNIIMSEWLK